MRIPSRSTLRAEVSLLHAWRAVWVVSACAQTSREPARGIEKWLAARSSRTLAKFYTPQQTNQLRD